MESFNKIKILSQAEALKIAAGEVVERPSSVVKELIENSIDASSSQISLFIERAGKKLIRILDNGHGMSFYDAKLCVYPHATSKITSLEDLEGISTFGFRGEALAAISAISKLSIITKMDGMSLGVKLVFDAGTLVEESDMAIGVGTDLIIEDLFFNTPVRKKFLKQDETEWNQIEQVFNAFCISYKDISFKLYKDGKLVVNAPATSSLQDRIRQLEDNNFAENFIVIDFEQRGVRVEGLISNHQSWHYNKNNIYFFVNKRFVKNTGLSRALIKGYLNVLPQDRFPAACLFVYVDPKSVDVNVHPRKEEVKFSHPIFIENVINEGVKKTLQTYISSKIKKVAEIENKETKNFDFSLSPFVQDSSFRQNAIVENNNKFSDLDFDFSSQAKVATIETSNISKNDPDNFFDIDLKRKPQLVEQSSIVHTNSSIIEAKNNGKIIGQLLNTYILIENESGLTIIDQHAAHERILYERFKKNFFKQEGTILMFPEVISISQNQKNLLLSHWESLSMIGLNIEDFGEEVIAIKSSPPALKNSPLKEVLLEIVSIMEESGFVESEQQRKLFFEKVHAMMSCKGAIKAGDVLNMDQMKQLVWDLSECENRLICVHGRPTIWSMSKNQLEKTFQRKL